MKAGLVDKRHYKQLTKLSAWAEFIGYFGSAALKFIQVSSIIFEQGARLMQGSRKKAEGGISPVTEMKELQPFASQAFDEDSVYLAGLR